MPTRAARFCSRPGCAQFAPCPTHSRQQEREYDQRRGTAAQRDYGARWQRLRKMVLARDPLCKIKQLCAGAPSTDADHIVSRRRGGKDMLENLQGACHECHSWKTATEDGGFGRRGAA